METVSTTWVLGHRESIRFHTPCLIYFVKKIMLAAGEMKRCKCGWWPLFFMLVLNLCSSAVGYRERRIFRMKKMNQKKVGTQYRLLLLFGFSIFLMSCISWVLEKPSFVIHRIVINPRSFTEMNLLLGIEAQNPNRFDLTLQSFEYTVYLGHEEIAKGRLEKSFLLPASSTTKIDVPVAVQFKDLGASLKAVFTGGDLPYKIEGKADVRALFGSLHFPFSKEGRIDLKN
jgi:LEA14-like dessication related protein